jgi:predicted Zn-dependent protease
MNKSIFLTSIAVSFLFYDCARNPVSGKSQVVLMSESQELAMGREADPQVVAQFGLYPDSALQQFIRQKGQEMVAISHRPNIQYQFRIVNSDVLNAFAIPGYVYFTRGIMGYFNNEAEFAGVLGHEIGHIAARHTVQQQRNATLGQIGIIAGMVISPQLAQFGQAASEGLGLLLLKNSRDAEREADRLGVEYSSKIGYDAQQMADFFNTLKRETAQSGGSALPPFMSTHPDPGERNTTVSKLAAEWKQKLNLTNAKVNRDSYLRRIEGLIYGTDPREGYLENSVFYHPGLKFQFSVPTGWAYQNSPQQVQLAPQEGKALLIFMGAQGNSLQEAANAAVQQYKLQVVSSGQVSLNGLPALAVIADQQQQDGSILRTLSYFIQQNNNIYHLIGVAMASDYSRYEPYFTHVAQSFKTLTDPAKLNKQPERIRIKTVNLQTTLEAALRSSGVPDRRLEELAILNGMNLSDRLAAGELIKIVE